MGKEITQGYEWGFTPKFSFDVVTNDDTAEFNALFRDHVWNKVAHYGSFLREEWK